MTTDVTVPLHLDDPPWVRKRRVAELHDLWLISGCSVPVMQLLLDHRHGRRHDTVEVEPEPVVWCSHCGDRPTECRGLCAACYAYRRYKGRLPSDALLERRRR